MKNSQGELLIECMQNSGMCFVNGRKGADEFTCISSKGCSVVDYCLVPTEELDGIDDFMVETMSRCEARLCRGEEGYRIPDHSVLSWKLLMAGAGVEDVAGGKGELSSGVTKQRYVVPEDFMVEESSLIERIIGDLKLVGGDQAKLDQVYDELCEGLKRNLKVVKGGKKSMNQPWFSTALAKLRKSMHRAEAAWLKNKGNSDQGESRNNYLRARNVYAKAVKKAKRDFQAQKRRELESELSCPKKFWRSIRRLNVRNTKKNGNLLEVRDEEGKLRTDAEAVEVWVNHFSKLLGTHKEKDDNTTSQCNRGGGQSEYEDRLCQPITMEEVQWALRRVRKDAAPGQDEVGAEMMMADCLADVWLNLFQICWEFSIVPSVWKEGIVVPVPKKQVRGVCEVDNFRGVSLSSIVCKVMCMVLNGRLSVVAEEEGLIAEEQGGFRKMRGCRDQVLSLVLLGQREMLKKSGGLMTAFIDFSKAYDRIDRGKLWKCLESMGVSEKFLSFLQSLYAGTSCRVRVGDRQSEVLNINVGLRQGCVLSPVLFSLYINSLVDQLKSTNCGIECAGEIIPGLLFADDTVLLAPDESGIKKSLDVLVKWCRDWGVKINVSKSGIMHVRQKRVARIDVQYLIDNEGIPMVDQYRYLGCVVDEHLELKSMVEERAWAGKRALGAWFHRCRTELGEVGVRVFRKLMSSLVESTMLYGAEVWGCNWDLEKIEQVQMRALRLFFGVGTLHPKVSLLAEMGDLPVRWLARMRCVMFWSKVLISGAYDGRLLRKIAVEAVRFGRGTWIGKMSTCWGQFGWKADNMEVLKELSTVEVREMMEAIAWRKVHEEWGQELEMKPAEEDYGVGRVVEVCKSDEKGR